MGQENESSKVTDLSSQRAVYEHYAPEQGTDNIPEWARRRELRTKIDSNIDTKKQLRHIPRPVTPRSKRRLKLRTKKEIFGSKECQKWYMKKLREALETKNGDDLYEYIKAHPKYAKASYLTWNKDFAALVGLKDIPSEFKGANEAITHRRIVAAAQHVLVEKYKNDVFQLTYTKGQVNPWIFVDGKMGPYSVSVLNDYWMAKYSKNSKKKPQPPGRSGLDGKDYEPNSSHAKTYKDALEHLDAQTKKGPEKEKLFELTKAQKENYKKVAPALKEVLSQMKMNLRENHFRMLTTHIIAKPEEISSQLVIAALKKMINEGQITDEEIGEARGLKKPPLLTKKSEKTKKAPEKKFDAKGKKSIERYKKLDTDKNIPLRELAIDSQAIEEDMPLSTALGLAYDQNPKDKRSHKIFRVLHLVAQKIGAKVESMRLNEGDTLSITPYGKLSITDANQKLRYPEVQFAERPAKKPVDKKNVKLNVKKREALAADIAKKKYRKLDKAGKIPSHQLGINIFEIDQDMTLSSALIQAYDEDADDSPKTFRILNLVAQKIGAKIESRNLKEDDYLSIIVSGNSARLIITDSENKLRYPEVEFTLSK